ncbi:MAG: recombinase family protein [Patescibacteria group bacterium]|jgi:site-specific DNA recombinase
MENKYFIYCRKSSEQEDRQVLSLESQEKELLEVARINKLKISGIYKESGSAHVIGRKLFDEMISKIEKGEANGLVVWDESRIARNSLDGGKVIYMMDLGQITEIYKPGKIYRNTPDDKSWMSMVFMMSKKESDDKGENVKRGLNTKAEKGWLPSGAKPGYMNDKYAEKGNKTIKVDPVRFPLIRQAWEMLVYKGFSIEKILHKLNNEMGYRSPTKKTIGGKPMWRSQLYKLFRDPFYYGYFEYPAKSGKWRKGQHKSMITEDEFNRAQVILGRKMAPRPHKTEFAYSGLITCGECGARITAEEKWHTVCSLCKTKFNSMNNNVCPNCETKTENMTKPVMRHYIYYHCTKKKKPNCTQRSVEVKDLENQLDSLLGEVQISERFHNWALKHLNELNEGEEKDRNQIIKSLQLAHSNCERKLDNLTALMISPANVDRSMMSDEEYKKRKTESLCELHQIDDRLSKAGEKVDDWMKVVEEKLSFAKKAREKFNNPNTTTEEKRELLFRLSSNLKLTNKNISALLENLYEPLRRVTKLDPTTKLEFEPKEITDRHGNLENYWNQNPLVLPRVGSNHGPSG